MKKTILFIASILNLVLSLQAQNNNQSNYVFGDTVDEEYLKKQFSNKSDYDYWFANPNATFIDQDWNSSFSIDLPDYAVFPVDAFTVIDNNRSYFPIMELPFKKVKIKDPDRDSTFIADVAFKNTQAKSDLIVSKDLFNRTLANLDQLNFKFANFPILTKLELQSNFTRIPSDIENAHNLRELVLASPSLDSLPNLKSAEQLLYLEISDPIRLKNLSDAIEGCHFSQLILKDLLSINNLTINKKEAHGESDYFIRNKKAKKVDVIEFSYFQDDFAKTVKDLKHLQIMHFSYSGPVDELPDLSHIKSIQRLTLFKQDASIRNSTYTNNIRITEAFKIDTTFRLLETTALFDIDGVPENVEIPVIHFLNGRWEHISENYDLKKFHRFLSEVNTKVLILAPKFAHLLNVELLDQEQLTAVYLTGDPTQYDTLLSEDILLSNKVYRFPYENLPYGIQYSDFIVDVLDIQQMPEVKSYGGIYALPFTKSYNFTDFNNPDYNPNDPFSNEKEKVRVGYFNGYRNEDSIKVAYLEPLLKEIAPLWLEQYKNYSLYNLGALPNFTDTKQNPLDYVQAFDFIILDVLKQSESENSKLIKDYSNIDITIENCNNGYSLPNLLYAGNYYKKYSERWHEYPYSRIVDAYRLINLDSISPAQKVLGSAEWGDDLSGNAKGMRVFISSLDNYLRRLETEEETKRALQKIIDVANKKYDSQDFGKAKELYARFFSIWGDDKDDDNGRWPLQMMKDRIKEIESMKVDN